MEVSEPDLAGVVAPVLSILPSPDSPSLDLLNDIRAMLSKRYPYLESIPILPMPEEASGKVLREDYKEGFSIDSNFLGLTVFDFEIKDQTSVPVPNRIEIRLTSQGKPLDRIRLIPTLLHEMAHVIHEHGKSFQQVIRRRKLKKMNADHLSHDDLFYKLFTKVLREAKEMGIYTLPAPFQRMTKRQILLFDRQDLIDCPLDLCGTSPLLSPPAPLTQIPLAETPLPLILMDPSGRRKPYTLLKRTLPVLMKDGRTRLALRKKVGRVQLLDGSEVTPAVLKRLAGGEVVLLLPPKK